MLCSTLILRGQMAKLVFISTEEEVELPDGSRIQEVCENAGVPFACTEGICGTCIVEVKEGMENLTPCTQEEIDFLGEQNKERLACQCKIKQGCVKISF